MECGKDGMCPNMVRTRPYIGSISRERWAGALMEVRLLLGLNFEVKKNALRMDGPTDQRTDRRTDPNIVT